MRIVRRRKDGLEIEIILRAWGMPSLVNPEAMKFWLQRKIPATTNVWDRRFPRQCSNAMGKEEASTGNVSLWSAACQKQSIHNVKAKQSYSSNPPTLRCSMSATQKILAFSCFVFCVVWKLQKTESHQRSWCMSQETNLHQVFWILILWVAC